MNTEIHNAFLNAVLADSSYVDGLLSGMTGPFLESKLQPRFPEKLARYVGETFRVLSQWTDPGNSGFSVTVFEDKQTSQRYISFRELKGSASLNFPE